MHDRLTRGIHIGETLSSSTDVLTMIRSGLVHIREQERLEADAPPEPVDRVERNVQIRRRRRARVPGAAAPPPPSPPPPPPPEPEMDVGHETEVESEPEEPEPSHTPSSQSFCIPGFERFASTYTPLSIIQEPSPFARVGQSSHGAAQSWSGAASSSQAEPSQSSLIPSHQPEECVTQAEHVSPQHVSHVVTYERRQGDRRRRKTVRYTPSSS